MSIITNIAGVMVISSMLCTGYPQQLLTTSEIINENQIQVGEKSIVKNLDYLKEDVKIPQLMGGNELKKINLINDTINNDIMPKVNEAEKIAKEYFDKPGQGNPTFPYEVYSKYTSTANSKSIISMYNNYYEYLGGAHGMTYKTSYTIDKEKEELVSLKGLFINGYNYKELINKEIKNQISKNPENYFNSGEEFKGINDNQSFYIDNDNLVIYYQLYEIAPYVAGFPKFKIPLKSFGENFIYYKDF